MIFGKKTGGFMDQIRCDEESYLIWKWHPSGVEKGENNRENAIRWGSSLSVKDGSLAVFVHYDKKENKVYQDKIKGPFQEIIKTDNLPIIASIVGSAYEGGTPFQCEVYFINLAEIIQIKFGVPFFDVFDPRFMDFGVPTAVRGTITFKITDYEKFIALHRLDEFNLDSFKVQIRDAVSRYVKDVVIGLPNVENFPVLKIESKISEVNDAIEGKLKERLYEDFGVNASGIDISAIEIDKNSEGYNELVAITKDITTATVQAKIAADLENYAENLRIQREEGQYAIHKQTQSSNIGAFQVEKQAEVGIAGAEALGQMGANGAGSVDLGGDGGGAGFNPATMMAGIALGGAVGQNIAGTMNGILSGVSQQQNASIPPIPAQGYHVAVNGEAAGPFSMDILKQMINNGQLSSETLLWKEGMQEWQKAENIDEIKTLFTASMPPIPKE